MQSQIKSHRTNRTYQAPHFFILAKGLNAGKPLVSPCPNCFVVILHSVQDREYLFWLSYGLWRVGYFHPYLVGSVIPFLRIEELKKIISDTSKVMERSKEFSTKTVKMMKDLQALEHRLSIQLHVVDQVRMSQMWTWLKYHTKPTPKSFN